jgi:hypothetical protein
MQDLAPYFSALSDHAMTLTLAALALGLASVIFLKFRAPWLARIQRKSLLTPNEIEFFHRLERALPAYRVFPQVSFAALLTDDGRLSTQARWSVRARFDRKIADFVVCEGGNLRVIAIIELDDRTHVASADRQRDAITKAAGYHTFRFQSRQKPSQAEISALFEHARAWTSA